MEKQGRTEITIREGNGFLRIYKNYYDGAFKKNRKILSSEQNAQGVYSIET